MEYVRPGEIEKRSFEIIGEELERRGIILPANEERITKRVIHATADFDYAHTLTFSPAAADIAKRLLAEGADIVTDTNMALAGISGKTLARFGGRVRCFMADEETARQAKRRGITRAAVSMEMAAGLPGPLIFAVGNAPTALIRLCQMWEEERFLPDFVIGVPVGFVNVEASKERLLASGIPCIVSRGRKGGSSVAAAICNALLYELGEES